MFFNSKFFHFQLSFKNDSYFLEKMNTWSEQQEDKEEKQAMI